MKKAVILLITFAIITSLCSCKHNIKNVTINEKTATLTIEDTDVGVEITFDGEEYNIFAGNLKGLYLYNVPDKLVKYFWGRWGFCGLYMTNNPDFGMTFLVDLVLLRLLDNPFDFPRYYLSNNSEIPNLETIAVSDIVSVINMGMVHDYVYTEWSNVNDLTSSGWTMVLDKELWNSENDTVLLGDIIDFEEPFTLNGRYIKCEEMVFTPVEYESFFCGPFDLIWTNGGEFYLRFSFNTDDEYIYKVRDKYQNIFEKIFEFSSYDWEYILGEDTPKSE